MNFDARKDYRQTLRFYNENVVPKESAEEGAAEGGEDAKVAIEGGPPQEDHKPYVH